MPRRKVQAAPVATAPGHVHVIRVVDRTRHLSMRDRQREIEFQVVNPTALSLRVLYVPLAKFCQGLRVYDADGKRLLVVPNRIVRDELASLKQDDPEHYNLLEQQTQGAKYTMLVVLPQDRPLSPGGTRIISIRFEEDDPVRSARWTPFSIPEFHLRQAKHTHQEHDHMMEIEAPPGFVIRGRTTVTGKRPTQSELHDAAVSGNARFTSARLPPAEGEAYTWEADYRLVPTRRLTAGILHLFLWASLVAAVVFGVLALRDAAAFSQLGQAVTGAFAGATIAMVYGIKDEWVERLKGLMVIPLVLHLAEWGLFANA